MVEARHQLGALGQRHQRGGIGAQITEIGRAQAQEIAGGVEGKLSFDQEIAALIIAEEGLRAVGDPPDRAPHPPRRPGDQREFGIGPVARAEIAADIARDHPELRFGNAKHRRDVAPRPPDAAAPGVKRVAAVSRVIFGERGARLHRYPGDALHPGGQRHDMIGAGETGLGRRRIADPGIDHEIGLPGVPEQRRIGRRR